MESYSSFRLVVHLAFSILFTIPTYWLKIAARGLEGRIMYDGYRILGTLFNIFQWRPTVHARYGFGAVPIEKLEAHPRIHNISFFHSAARLIILCNGTTKFTMNFTVVKQTLESSWQNDSQRLYTTWRDYASRTVRANTKIVFFL